MTADQSRGWRAASDLTHLLTRLTDATEDKEAKALLRAAWLPIAQAGNILGDTFAPMGSTTSVDSYSPFVVWAEPEDYRAITYRDIALGCLDTAIIDRKAAEKADRQHAERVRDAEVSAAKEAAVAHECTDALIGFPLVEDASPTWNPVVDFLTSRFEPEVTQR